MKNKILQVSAYILLLFSMGVGAFFLFLRYAEFSKDKNYMYYDNRWKVPFFEEDDYCYFNEQVPIYSSSNTKSSVVGYLEPGEEFSGTPNYPWIELSDNRGFVLFTPGSSENRCNFYNMRTPLGLFQIHFKYGGYVTFFIILLVFMLISVAGKIALSIYDNQLTIEQNRWLTMIRASVYFAVGAALIYYVFEDINGRGMAKPSFYDGQMPSIWWMSFYYMKGWALLTIPICSAILFSFSCWTLYMWEDYANNCLKQLKNESIGGIIINVIFTILFYPLSVVAGVIGAIMGIIGLFIVGIFLSAPKALKDTAIDAAEGKLHDATITDEHGNNKKEVTKIGGLYTDFEGNWYKKKWGIDEVEKI